MIPWATVAAVLALAAFMPYATIQLALLIRNRRLWEARAPVPVPGRRLLAVIATNGRAVRITNAIVRIVRSYRLAVEAYVLVEEGDPGAYEAPRIEVPASYRTPRGSTFKCRALHYYSEWLRTQPGDVYTLHLDDDSVPSIEYLRHALALREDAGQGLLRLRATHRHPLNTASDLVRIVDCDTYCAYANSRGRPVHVHGEGLVIRGTVESALGWDFGDRLPDDFLMGQRLRLAGASFAHLPAYIYIAPPTTVGDFFRQRRRWFTFFHRALGESWRMNRMATAWLVARELSAPATFLGFGVWVYVVALRLPMPPAVEYASTVNLGLSMILMQYGAYRTRSAAVQAYGALLLVPAAVYQASAWLYTAFSDARSFETIQKV